MQSVEVFLVIFYHIPSLIPARGHGYWFVMISDYGGVNCLVVFYSTIFGKKCQLVVWGWGNESARRSEGHFSTLREFVGLHNIVFYIVKLLIGNSS